MFVVFFVYSGFVEKKVDEQGRLVIPKEWLQEIFGDSRLARLFKVDGELRIVPERKVSLLSFKAKAQPSKLNPFNDYDGVVAQATAKRLLG